MVLFGKTFRVFVSSTFADLKEERNALQKHVFPKLRELCMEHGFRFQAIDLRWGVSEEAGLDQQTMKICLEEIERSQRVSPKPNFIVLLGDRYGWRPLPYKIPAEEFEEIKKVISPSDKDFLFWEGDVLEDDQLKKCERWYCRDENAIPPVYCLKPRLVDYDENASDDDIKKARDLEYKDWEIIEKRLKSILLNAINDLGWDKDDSRRFKYESSATEQEIITGVLNLPKDDSLSEEHVFSFMRTIKDKKSILFDDNSKDFFDFTASGIIDASAEEKLIALKDKIDDKLPSSNIFDYETEWEGKGVSKQHIEKLCDDVYSSLEKVINEQINEFEDKDPLEMEKEVHKEFGEERCRFFIGREDNRAQIKNYLDSPNSKPLIVYGESGSGKSAIMAQAVEDLHFDFYKVPVDNVVVRFIGATPESSDMRSLLESLGRQITIIYGEDDSHIPTDYNDLVQDFKERLNFPTAEKPLFIFIDALDQLYDSESAHNLTWLPDELPENAHIVISTLKNIFQSSLEHRYVDNTVEVLPLEKNDGKTILEAWFKDNKRKLTDKQENEIISKFEVEGLPLYLKVAFEESKLWKSYTPVPKFESDIKWMINNLFERLSRPENHGEILVSRSLGYLSAAKNGLTEDEMLDILARDDDVFGLTTKFNEPTENKLPVALWSRLYFDLEPYLTERSADETTLLAFYHRQLGDVAGKKYLDNSVKKSRHQLIAEYFYKQDLYFEQDEERVYNVRKVSELPYQETYSERWEYLENTLCDLRFVEAKCAVGKTYELINDYSIALNLHPDNNKEKTKRFEYEKLVNKYVKDLVTYSKGKIDYLDIIPSIRPLTEEEIKKETEHSNNNSDFLTKIKAFMQFVNSQSHALDEFGYIPSFCIQQAYNFSNSGYITKAALQIMKNYVKNSLILRDKNKLFAYDPHPAIIKKLEDHMDFVSSVAITPDGKKAICGNTDKYIYLWNLKTGKQLKKLEGHIDVVSSVAITPDGKKAISGSLDATIRIWDLETGITLKTLDGPSGVKAVAITPDCLKVIGGIGDVVFVWDLKTNKNLRILKGHTKDITALDMTSDGGIIISGSEDETVRVFNQKTGQTKTLIGNHKYGVFNRVLDVAVTPEGKTAVSGSGDDVFVWDLETGKNLQILKGHKNDVTGVKITADGKFVISGSIDKNVIVWDVERGKQIKKFQSHTSFNDIDATPDCKIAITGNGDRTLCLWDLEMGISINQFEMNTGSVNNIIVTPEGKKALSICQNDENMYLWDIESGKLLKTLNGHSNFIIDMAITSDGKKAISCSKDKNLCVWDLKTTELLKTLEGHSNIVNTVTITPDNKKAISGSWDETIRIWDLKTGKTLKILECQGGVNVVAVTPDGRLAVSGSTEGIIIVIDLKTGKKIKTLKGPFPGYKYLVVVTPDGKRIIATGIREIFVWDLETGKLIRKFSHQDDDEIRGVFVSPDGKKVVSECLDNKCLVWDLDSYKCLKELSGHTCWINPVVITPDGKKIISGGEDKILQILDINEGKLLAISKEENLIESLSVKANGLLIFGSSKGFIITSHMINLDLGFPLITARRIWLNDHWDEKIITFCPYCGNSFNVSDAILKIIINIENLYEKPNGWISDEAWDDPRLISECPKCTNKIKFNPFIVDNSR